MRNLITDVAGVRVGSASDESIATGVTAVIFERPSVASIAVSGGAPALRDTALLEPDMAVEAVDGFCLSGGSVFGLDAAGGVLAVLREQGRGLPVAGARAPIVPGASLFDLANGGDKNFWREPVYWRLGAQAARAAGQDIALGTAGAGYGATLADLKGGLGSASATIGDWTIGALVAVNAVGQATIGDGPHFWAAPYERDAECSGLGWPPHIAAPKLKIKGAGPQNTTLAVVATDATLTKAQARRVAIMAQDGFARALRPVHAAMDGDVVFSAATAHARAPENAIELTIIGAAAADVLARAIARAVHQATELGFANALPSWRRKFFGQSTGAAPKRAE